jgi:hypothetical protein
MPDSCYRNGPVLLFRVIDCGGVLPLLGFGIERGQAALDQAGLFGADGDQHFVHLEDREGFNADEVADAAVVPAGVDAINPEELGDDTGRGPGMVALDHRISFWRLGQGVFRGIHRGWCRWVFGYLVGV